VHTVSISRSNEYSKGLLNYGHETVSCMVTVSDEVSMVYPVVFKLNVVALDFVIVIPLALGGFIS
jgi:hypothetical protein